MKRLPDGIPALLTTKALVLEHHHRKRELVTGSVCTRDALQ